MTVQSQTIKARYAGNGAATEFPTLFAFVDDGHVRAVVRRPDAAAPGGYVDTGLAYGTEFTLSGRGDPGGGTLTLPAPLPEGETLTIYSDVPATQEVGWNNFDVIDLDEMEKAYDKLTRVSLQMKEELSRCVKYPVAAPDPSEALEPEALLAARDQAVNARDGALASEGASAASAASSANASAVAAGAATLASDYADDAAGFRDEAREARDEASASETYAAQYAAQAFGAAAPAYDPGASYGFPDVVAFTDGHTYRAVAAVSGEDPPWSAGWVRVTVGYGDFFEQDDEGDIMPSPAPMYSEQFALDADGDIIPAG